MKKYIVYRFYMVNSSKNKKILSFSTFIETLSVNLYLLLYTYANTFIDRIHYFE